VYSLGSMAWVVAPWLVTQRKLRSEQAKIERRSGDDLWDVLGLGMYEDHANNGSESVSR